jgi:hypothetical protein
MGKPNPKERPGSWIVQVRCTVIKEVVCDDCTEEQASEDPWTRATDESEITMTDWEILKVEANV